MTDNLVNRYLNKNPYAIYDKHIFICKSVDIFKSVLRYLTVYNYCWCTGDSLDTDLDYLWGAKNISYVLYVHRLSYVQWGAAADCSSDRYADMVRINFDSIEAVNEFFERR
jgi:hypothetical protein